ncbi:hypothetical protein [Roseiarcus sp.]|jgi:hypothetical protein|uniref:hypothetical protein n=1 Tax=Roseiarcus sp. TaxID=1969460 RepID=UPI003C4DFDD5
MCDLRGMAGKLRSGGAQSVVASIACWALILACAGQSRAQGQTAPQLQGVYAHVDLEFAINEYFRQNGGVTPAPCPPPGTPDLHAYLQNIYTGLLKNTAVAGLALGAHWCLIGTTGDGVNDWSYTDEAFAAAAAANKNVQLLITPGVDSPSWLFLVGQSCDPVIKAESPNPEYQYCDWVTFKTLPESVQHHDSMTLPLPFSPIYAGRWKAFLEELKSQYAGNSLYSSAFVSISVAEPVSVSPEMILPTTANNSKFKDKPMLPVDTGWEYLVDTIFPSTLPGSPGQYYGIWGQAFIDAWEHVFVDYESNFSGLTLILTPDDGKNMPELQYGTGNPTTLLGTDCSLDTVEGPLSCGTKAIVLTDFVAAQGPNQKAAMVGGFTASSEPKTGDIGLPAIKALTLIPISPQSPRFLGGAQFDYAVSTDDEKTTQKEGCKRKGCKVNLTPPQAAYNVLANFFSGTIAAGNYGTSSPPPYAALNFLNIDYRDILYANDHPCMEDLITQASRDLLATAGKAQFQPSTPESCWLQ